jgi:hypothetical protein
MKYIIRLIALPFWAIIYLIFAIYRVIVGLLKLCYGFIIHGGEQITYDGTLNRNTIFKTYLKLEEMELRIKVDPRSQCNHVWEQEVGYGQTTAPRQKCVICGVQLNTNHFTQ